MLSHRGQLMKVADTEQLHTAERQVVISPYAAQYRVDCIHHIASHHAYFVYDQQFGFAEQLKPLCIIPYFFKQIVFAVGRRKIGVKRKLEKTMECDTPGINGRNPCGCGHHSIFGTILFQVFKKSCFTGTSFTRKKYILRSFGNETKG